MKALIFVVYCYLLTTAIPWQPNFETAQKIASEKHSLILLNFSGSDWCGPCMRMRKEIFESNAFLAMANSNLVLVNADFPRNKKNQLGKELIKQNESLADKYNPEGKFPFTVLLNADGKIIRAWDGLPAENATAFTIHVKKICDAAK